MLAQAREDAYVVALRRGLSHDDAEDVAQQTVVELLLRDQRGAPEPANPRKHARGVARNLAGDSMARAISARNRETSLDAPRTIAVCGRERQEIEWQLPSPSSSEDDCLDAILARDAFAALSPAQQDAIEAVAESISSTNRRYPCIAEGLGITPAAAWARVSRARRHVLTAA